jgi:hypothetical protein
VTQRIRDAMREEFLALARNVLQQGGQLLYPYPFGAIVIRAARPTQARDQRPPGKLDPLSTEGISSS